VKSQLKKEISFFGALSTVMGTVIGAGVFFKAAAVVQQTQSTGLTLLVWLLAGFLTICGGLTVAELATAIPETGGPIRYIERIYGKLPSFLLGWAQSIIYFPANVAALSIIFATQCLNLFHLPSNYLLPLSILTGTSVTLINLLGTKAGALLATLFAYDGWMGVGNVAGEMKRPEKDLPKAIIFGLSFVTLVYVLINVAFLKTLPIDQIAGNLNSASETAMALFGSFGGKLVTIGILISVYGALNGYTMTGLRVPYAMALEDEIPFSKTFATLSKTTNAPYAAAFLQLGIACIMMLLGTFDLLTDMLVFVMWFFSVLLFVGVFRLRKTEPQMKRPYKVPFYPIIPLIAILGGCFILIMTLITDTWLAVVGIGVTLLGIPVFYGKAKGKARGAKE